ncbi:MAG: MBL fold metallo-hydrolase [Eubacteriales bacterium]|nr:MBL fold metallo-hydrolase [Eubacteriales bacterium]
MADLSQERIFTARKFHESTWVITGRGCECYLLIGENKAMLVDAGQSRRNLREFVQTITDLPAFVVNTHGHFDHTGGNGWFDEVYMHANAVRDAKRAFDDPDGYPLDYDIQTVAQGHVFDLGGRTVEVIEIPAHSPGSIALLDRECRMLFTGDELESGQVLLLRGGKEVVAQHRENMLKLKRRKDEFDSICPAHNGTPIHPSYIDAFIENDSRVLAGQEGSADCASPTFDCYNPASPFKGKPSWRRSTYAGSAIVYDLA